MSWNPPMTAVANSTFSDVEYNRNIRDNLLSQAPAKATSVGSYFTTTATGAIAERQISSQTIATAESTSSGSYTDLATVGPTVTATVTQGAMVWWAANMNNGTANSVARVSIVVSGSNSMEAGDDIALYTDGTAAAQPARLSTFHLFTNLNPGSTKFKVVYRVGAATTFKDRSLIVMPL